MECSRSCYHRGGGADACWDTCCWYPPCVGYCDVGYGAWPGYGACPGWPG